MKTISKAFKIAKADRIRISVPKKKRQFNESNEWKKGKNWLKPAKQINLCLWWKSISLWDAQHYNSTLSPTNEYEWNQTYRRLYWSVALALEEVHVEILFFVFCGFSSPFVWFGIGVLSLFIYKYVYRCMCECSSSKKSISFP